jgi:hypothetical protein
MKMVVVGWKGMIVDVVDIFESNPQGYIIMIDPGLFIAYYSLASRNMLAAFSFRCPPRRPGE